MSADNPPLWRRGLVKAVDGKTARAQVFFPDEDGLTLWFPVVSPLTIGAKIYALPRIDTQVVVLMDERGEDGIILGSIYSKVDPPPVQDPLLVHVLFDDGSIIEYDSTAKRLLVNAVGRVEIEAIGEVNVIGHASITLKAPAISLDGPTTIQGPLIVLEDIKATKDVTAGEISLQLHKHQAQGPTSPTSKAIS